MSQGLNNVLITRPEHQAGPLIAQLQQLGFKPVKCPTIAISLPINCHRPLTNLQRLNTYSQLIFTSANAVHFANQLLDHQWPNTKAQIIAVGPKTQQALIDIGLSKVRCSLPPFNSEQVLQLIDKPSNLELSPRCLIIKGEGGREWLNDSLKKAGFIVEHANVYRRCLAKKSDIPAPSELPFITITSQLALDNLFLLYPENTPLFKQNSLFITLSKRIAHYAESLGCQHIVFAGNASDDGLVSALNQHLS